MNADHFYEHNQNHIGENLVEISKVIVAVRLIKEAAGGSLDDYILRESRRC